MVLRLRDGFLRSCVVSWLSCITHAPGLHYVRTFAITLSQFRKLVPMRMMIFNNQDR